MARLYRPAIPLSVKCEVAARQVMRGSSPTVSFLAVPERPLWLRLHVLLTKLAQQTGCKFGELRLDHDPALALRKRKGEGKRTVYTPAANNPAYLRYRPHGTQFENSHDVKTRIRGDHGQFSDIQLIKRKRRRERGPKPKRGPKIKSRGFGPSRKFNPFHKRKP